tara:strand:- start:2965 stop:4104 length:1140 start_codon:yes stop_codon:yes gene_type:complete
MEWLSFDTLSNLYETGILKSLLIQSGIIFFIAIFFDVLQRKLIKEVLTKIEHKRSKYLIFVTLLETMRKPTTFILYIMAVTVSIGLINQNLDIELLDKVKSLRGLLILASIGHFSFNFIKGIKNGKLQDIEKEEIKGDKTTIQIAANISNVLMFVIIGMMALQELGLSVSGLMAFGGIGGLIVGLSAKEFLADFFGGLILIADKPFKVGDWIRSPDRNIEGTVEDIGMRRICVRTFDKRPLYIPNSVLSTVTIENPSRMTHRRIYETIGLRYEDADKMSSITRKVREMLESHSGIDSSQTLMVNFNTYGSSSLDFFIYTFTKTTDWKTYHGIKHNIMLSIYEIIKEEGADIAFPTTVVNINKEQPSESLLEMMKQELNK